VSRSVMVVAGETSGDMHAARIIGAVHERDPDIEFWGIGGDAMEERGVRLEEHVRDMDALGISEVLRKYFYFRRVFKRMLALARERRPDAILLVDYPGFNLRLARAVKREGFKVVYYVCPQVWAWHRSRIAKMARIIDRLLVIFPFEKELFDETGMSVDFVGHPLVDTARQLREADPVDLPWGAGRRIAILPGSRRQEIERILPLMWETAGLAEQADPELSFIIATPSKEVSDLIEGLISGLKKGPSHYELVAGKTRHVLWQAHAAMVASGTATIEATLMRCPMIIVYAVARFTYWLGKRLIQVPHIGMVNIVAKRGLCPEFIQHEALPEKMAESLSAIVEDGPAREEMLAGLDQVAEMLGVDDGIDRAGEAVIEVVETASTLSGKPGGD